MRETGSLSWAVSGGELWMIFAWFVDHVFHLVLHGDVYTNASQCAVPCFLKYPLKWRTVVAITGQASNHGPAISQRKLGWQFTARCKWAFQLARGFGQNVVGSKSDGRGMQNQRKSAKDLEAFVYHLHHDVCRISAHMCETCLGGSCFCCVLCVLQACRSIEKL